MHLQSLTMITYNFTEYTFGFYGGVYTNKCPYEFPHSCQYLLSPIVKDPEIVCASFNAA